MKKLFALFVALSVAGAYLHANVLTVCNNAYSPGQYTNLQTAINAANNGDSIYVEPSPIDYGTINIPKKLFLFGGGGDPYTYQVNNNTQIDAATFTTQTLPPATSDGSQIEGFYVGSISINNNLSNITVMRNYLNGGVNIGGVDTNIVIVNNIFNNCQVYMTSSFNNDNSVLIANNFFNNVNGSQAVFENNGSQDQETGVQILNNIMYGNSITAGNSDIFFRTLNNASVKNNIFYCAGGNNPPTFASGCSACDMENNITYTESLVSQTLPDGNNTGTGNFNNIVATPFVAGGPPAYTAIASYNLYSYNFNVIGTYHNAGSDGTDVGIYGGPYPFPNFETITRLPQMRFLQISNPSVQPGGTLNVNVIGTTHN
jgi:hypothetical protein